MLTKQIKTKLEEQSSFRSCISNINNTFIDNAYNLDIAKLV